MPKRIQRKRTKGWRMPPDTIYVGRPTKWGNPYKAVEYPTGWYVLPSGAGCGGYRQIKEDAIRLSVWLFKQWATLRARIMPNWLSPLRGKNLCCWCPLDQPCHADVLLELANPNE